MISFSLTLLMQIGIVFFAFVAAWRYKLKGLWFLAVGMVIWLLQSVMYIWASSPFNWIGQRLAENYLPWGVSWLPFITAILALIGWCLLAFNQKNGVPSARTLLRYIITFFACIGIAISLAFVYVIHLIPPGEGAFGIAKAVPFLIVMYSVIFQCLIWFPASLEAVRKVRF